MEIWGNNLQGSFILLIMNLSLSVFIWYYAYVMNE